MQDKFAAPNQVDTKTTEIRANLLAKFSPKKSSKTNTKKIEMTELEALKKIQEHFLANPFSPDGETDYKRLREGIKIALGAEVFPQVLMKKTIKLFHAGELDPNRPAIPISLEERLELVCNHLRENPFYPDRKTDFKHLSDTAREVLQTHVIGCELMDKLIEKYKEGEFLPSGPIHLLSPEEKLICILEFFVKHPFEPDGVTDYALLWRGANTALASEADKELVDALIVIFHDIREADRKATFLTEQAFAEVAAALLQEADDGATETRQSEE